MKSDIFYKWFVEWEKKTRSNSSDEVPEGRLMIYDGHLSHVVSQLCNARLNGKL